MKMVMPMSKGKMRIAAEYGRIYPGEDDLRHVFEFLKQAIDKESSGEWENLQLSCSQWSGEYSDEWYINGCRWETDAEYQFRIKHEKERERKAEYNRKAREEAKKEREREEYERLKKKFEKGDTTC